ncbi:MAG: hypothetical protein R3B70_02075 [Polyangiaceae bacterium]
MFERNLGHDRAVYFFVGSCAYPEGLAVLLFSFTRGSVARSTFNPYDTGFLKHVAIPRRPADTWDDTAKTQHIQSTMGWTRDLHAFGGPYLAAHFRDPIDYVRRPQDGVPDFEPYHGLGGGDRRAWTIEARLHDDVTIEPNGQELLEIWLEDQSLLRELPVDFRRYARIKRDGMTLAESVAQRIERKISEVSP